LSTAGISSLAEKIYMTDILCARSAALAVLLLDRIGKFLSEFRTDPNCAEVFLPFYHLIGVNLLKASRLVYLGADQCELVPGNRAEITTQDQTDMQADAKVERLCSNLYLSDGFDRFLGGLDGS